MTTPAPDRQADNLARWRLSAYTAALAIAFGLHGLVAGIGRGPVFWVAAAIVGALLGLGIASPDRGRRAAASRAGAIAAALLALAVPGGAGAGIVWPQVLVALFASRVLAEVAAERFSAFWRDPLAGGGPPSGQSMLAALALGAALALAFYQVMALLPPVDAGSPTFSGIVERALRGETAVHRGIVFLFFFLLAATGESFLRLGRDRAALQLLRADATRRLGTRPRLATVELDRLVRDPTAPWAASRPAFAIAGEIGAARRHAPDRADASGAFHGATRRFLRGMLPLLPLLGFFGTVIGLVAAIAGLTGGLGGGGRGGFDIDASLAGLAIKFETTLLGLLASMILSLLLAILEKGEAELVASATHLAAALDGRDGP